MQHIRRFVPLVSRASIRMPARSLASKPVLSGPQFIQGSSQSPSAPSASSSGAPLTNETQKIMTKSGTVRNLVEARISGVLTTVSSSSDQEQRKPEAFGSLMPYILNEKGYPIFGISPSETHHTNIEESPLGSLMVNVLTPDHILPSQVPHLPTVLFLGKITQLTSEEIEKNNYQRKFLNVHPGASDYLSEYIFYSIREPFIYLCNNATNEMEEIRHDVYESEIVDPLSKNARFVFPLVNTKSKKYLIVLAEKLANVKVQEAWMYWIDRHGFNLHCTLKPENSEQNPNQVADIRIPFPFEMTNSFEIADAIREAAIHEMGPNLGQKAEDYSQVPFPEIEAEEEASKAH
eukprot:TRINITY_DN9291_c0_g1_i1.p1 TRINITY_DN9291_c0_g1~~TRINITY_DN9291_c0_g1_i1.p1  ORF type:complete len:348 (-),score=129.59 TRINITY_DN9291_c0_g1_i1:553-1596(-)